MLTKQNKWEADGLLAIRCLSENEGNPARERWPQYEVEQQRIPKIISEMAVTIARARARRIRQSSVISSLEEAANKGNETAFLKALDEVSWQEKPATEFVRLIKLAFRAGAFGAARHITAEAAKYHSRNDAIQKYAQLLSSQRRTPTVVESAPNTRANRAWLEEHAGEYRGQWVALHNGELLGAANSLPALVDEVKRKHNVTFPSKEIMVTTGY